MKRSTCPRIIHTEKVDHEYVRNGTCCGFMFTAPLECWRRVSIREHRCKTDWTQEIKQLVDEDFPDVEKIVLVCDNLNTHDISSLYEAFEPAEARRIWEKLELHHTPKHGSWLDMAEIELSAFTKECLGRRIGDSEALKAEAAAWYLDRNHRQKDIDWQFSVGDARTRLKHLYPIIKIKN
ncbi:MAG: transposase [Bacteroidales bacterium]|nr:transposase [Bacteroidales bacterium]